MSTMKNRFADVCAETTKRTRVMVYGQEEILSFFHQELLTLAEEMEKMTIPKPQCYCRQYSLGEHSCDITSNDAVKDVAAFIRSKAAELE